MENSISHVGRSLLNMSLSSLCRVGISSILSFTFQGWVIHFFLPFDLCHIIITTNPKDKKASKLWSRVTYMFKS